MEWMHDTIGAQTNCFKIRICGIVSINFYLSVFQKVRCDLK